MDTDDERELVDVCAPAEVPDGWIGVLRARGERGRPAVLVHADTPALRRMAAFDVVVNNADRKGGHVLAGTDGHLYGVDHGLTLHVEDKLRTVLWGWVGQPLPADVVEPLEKLRAELDGGLAARGCASTSPAARSARWPTGCRGCWTPGASRSRPGTARRFPGPPSDRAPRLRRVSTAASPMPAAFIGHGSPMNALDSNRYTRSWHALGAALPRPRAILVISAHWYINATAVTAMARPRTIHDFFGFSRDLFAWTTRRRARRSWPRRSRRSPSRPGSGRTWTAGASTTAPGRCSPTCTRTRTSRSCSCRSTR